jgi:phenolic acid decarboxylase
MTTLRDLRRDFDEIKQQTKQTEQAIIIQWTDETGTTVYDQWNLNTGIQRIITFSQKVQEKNNILTVNDETMLKPIGEE